MHSAAWRWGAVFLCAGLSACFTPNTQHDPDDLLEDELLQETRNEYLAAEYGPAWVYAEELLERSIDPTQTQEALYFAGLARLGEEERRAAFRHFATLVEDYPYSAYLPELEKPMYEIGEFYMNREPSRVWGDLFSGRPFGIEVMRLFVSTFPLSDQADDALVRTADYYFERDEYDFAADKYEALVQGYPASEWFDLSLYRVGLSRFRHSRGPGYDDRILQQARRDLIRYLARLENGIHRAEAEESLRVTEETLAQSEMMIANLYLAREQDRGARIHLANVVLAYPSTPTADQARMELEQRGWDVSINTLDTVAPAPAANRERR